MKIIAYTIPTMIGEILTFIGALIWNYSLMWLFLPVGLLNAFLIGALVFGTISNRNK